MSLILHLAQTSRGARTLRTSLAVSFVACVPYSRYAVECGLFERLKEMHILEQRPEHPVESETFFWSAPSLMNRYYQLTLPVWEVVVAVTSSLKGGVGVVKEVAQFIAVHKRIVSLVLKNRFDLPCAG